jgi:hypothetical protein
MTGSRGFAYCGALLSARALLDVDSTGRCSYLLAMRAIFDHVVVVDLVLVPNGGW